jgi:hypothetical protein
MSVGKGLVGKERQQHGQLVYLQAVDDRTGQEQQSMTDARRSADESEDEALSTSIGNQFLGVRDNSPFSLMFGYWFEFWFTHMVTSRSSP